MRLMQKIVLMRIAKEIGMPEKTVQYVIDQKHTSREYETIIQLLQAIKDGYFTYRVVKNGFTVAITEKGKKENLSVRMK